MATKKENEEPTGARHGSKIVTRTHFTGRQAGEKTGVVRATETGRTSIVSRRTGWLKRRRKRILTVIAIALAVFPPVWIVYFLSWLIWRRRPRQRSMRQVRKAVRALEKDRTGIALQKLQGAHYLDPSNSDALYWMGLLMSGQRRHEEAEEALSIVAERVPGLPEVEAALVDAYIAMNRPDSAVFHAQRLLDSDPYSNRTLLKLADAFEAAKKPDLAISALERAPLHKPTLTDELVTVHYRLGALYEAAGDRARALDHFKRVYARDIAFRDVRERIEALEDAE